MMAGTPRLRPFAAEDFEAIFRLDQACFPPRIAYSRRTMRTYLRLPGAQCIVAEQDGTLAGFILLYAAGRQGHIVTLDVAEPHRRAGLGTLLLRAAERALAARGVTRVELETATHNEPAVAFWQKHGYRSFGQFPGYYEDGSDAWLMFKMLRPPEENSPE